MKGTVKKPIDEFDLDELSLVLDKLNPPILFLKCKTSGQIKGVLKKSRSATEEYNLKRLFLHCLPGHCVSLLKSTSSIFMMNFIQPFQHQPSIKSFKCLLAWHRQVPNIALVLKSALFQTIAILNHLQMFNTQFCHNDFKADNIMLEKCYCNLEFGTYRINSWGVRVILIDAETVTGIGYKTSPLLKKLSKSSRAAFGFDTLFSPYTDLHLLCMEILLECKRNSPSWKAEFVQFLSNDCIPLEYFKDVYVTTENRLNTVGRLALEQLSRPLAKMLDSPYFKDILIVPNAFSDALVLK